ncbi:uncharacterized protein OGAPODRAFT_93567 [Ogataea polymorpha]|uniref:uncharacterized protein n=1 Tax=Ogataea polymorpha TaxID=460523 RepID=UPI0007F3F15C|nr:uncharacterized protein OGAPODRAFT_93567 [Ogataea polymorpha]OBA16592.1 hypothetical protein OGAPODRAFT_93567 [Ogataea polymorpha]
MSSFKIGSVKTEEITFEDLAEEHDYRVFNFWTLVSYLIMLTEICLSFGFLASDIYTLVQIYALNDWDSYHAISYVPLLAYRIIFTACIGISMTWLIANWWYGIHIYRTNNIVRSHLNDVARQINSLKSYERFCIYERSTTKSFFDWFSLTTYRSYYFSIYLWLLADTPRQILNGATVAYSISNSFTSSEIVNVVVAIAQTNKREAVLLSFMTFSFIVWVIFTAKYICVIIGSFFVVSKVHSRHKTTFRKYCRRLVADSVIELYEKHEEELRRNHYREYKDRANDLAEKPASLTNEFLPFRDAYDNLSKDSLQKPGFAKDPFKSTNNSSDSLPSFPENPFNEVINVSQTKQNRALAEKLDIPYPQELALNDSTMPDFDSHGQVIYVSKSSTYSSRKPSDNSIERTLLVDRAPPRSIYASASLDQNLRKYT